MILAAPSNQWQIYLRQRWDSTGPILYYQPWKHIIEDGLQLSQEILCINPLK